MAYRVRFGTVSKQDGKSIDEMIAELWHASMDVGFGDQFEGRLKHQFVIGLRSDYIKKKLFENEDRDLADIIKKARALELMDREHSSSKSISNHTDTQHVRTSRSLKLEVDTQSHAKQQRSVSCHRCGRP